MNQTTNYQLPQWEAGDTVKREDFNDLASKTDAALAGLQTAVEGAASVVFGSYRGNGTYPRDITLGFRPKAVILATSTGIMSSGGTTLGGLFGSQLGNLGSVASVTNTGFQLTGDHTNISGYIFHFIAFQ